jgi:ABC-type glutathione transport system ATPase component
MYTEGEIFTLNKSERRNFRGPQNAYIAQGPTPVVNEMHTKEEISVQKRI